MFRRSLVFAAMFALATVAMFALAQGLDHWRYMALRMGAVEQRLAEARVTMEGEMDALRTRQNADAMMSFDSLAKLTGDLRSVKADVDSGLQSVNARIDGIPVPHEWDFDAMRRSSVLVTNGRGHGSGVIIGPNSVITNAHVAGDNDKMTVRFHDGTDAEATVMWVSKTGDFSLLHVDALPSDAVQRELACRDPILGEPVATLGNPTVSRQTVTVGIVASTKRLEIPQPPTQTPQEVPPYVVLDLKINPGNSGGPIFDKDGKVLGLATATLITMMGFGSPSQSGLGLMWPAVDFCESLGRW